MRLKDKLGDHSNAGTEVEYHGAWGEMIGEDGKGVRTILDMVVHTRLDCGLGSAALMRQAVRLATFHASHRSAFKGVLIDKPAMQNVLVDMGLETEAALRMVCCRHLAFAGLVVWPLPVGCYSLVAVSRSLTFFLCCCVTSAVGHAHCKGL